MRWLAIAAGLFAAAPAAAWPPATATWYTETDARLHCLVIEHFELARSCWGQKKRPSRWTVSRMARGLVAGQRRFWPERYDQSLTVLAYILTETGGNTVDIPTRWGREVGCCGLNIMLALEACAFWHIPAPRTESGMRRRLLEDPEFCTMLTYAALVMEAGRAGGSLEHGVAIVKFGGTGWARERSKAPMEEWPQFRHFNRMRAWLWCILDPKRVGAPCVCLPASRAAS